MVHVDVTTVYFCITYWTCKFLGFVMDNVSVNTYDSCGFLYTYGFIFLGCRPRSRIAGSHGNCLTLWLIAKVFSKLAVSITSFSLTLAIVCL